MNIIVVGCGKIGKAVIESLLAEGHKITAVDGSQAILDEVTNIFDVMTVCGNGADVDSLTEAGVEKCDLLISSTQSDEKNMLICFMGKKLGAKHTIARIRNPEFNDKSLGFVKQQLGLSLSINPELLVAREALNVLKLPSAIKIETFSRNFELVEVKLSPNSVLDGMALKDMREKYKAKYLICTVERNGEIFIPDGNFALKSGDQIGIISAPSEIQKLLKMLGMLKKQSSSVMIIGGSKASIYLAKMLQEVGICTKIIEARPEKCKELSDRLPNTTIICADGTQQDVLLEEGINDTDAFVALTGMDEQNILISIYAFLQNVPKVITKINREELSALSDKIGLESIISPMTVTSDRVLQYARALQNSMGSNVEMLYKLMDGKAEALEFKVVENPKLTGIPLKDLSLKKNILIGGIIRGRKIIHPSGNDEILAGDKVVVIAAGRCLNDLTDILL